MNLRPRGYDIISAIGRNIATLAVILVVGTVVLGGAWCTCVGMSAGDDARRTLESAGYDDIELGSPNRYRCSEKDTFSNTFTATNPRGNRVEGIVCCGWSAGCLGKACTIRF